MAPSVDKWPLDRKELGSVSVWETEPIILWAQTHIATLDHFSRHRVFGPVASIAREEPNWRPY